MAIGTAWAQKRRRAKGLTVVTGGDAGSAEGDFATCLVWASRKGYELPLLITVQNNGWGISTPYEGQHGEDSIADRGKAFNMRTAVINGNDPIESYIRLQEELTYIRTTGKPVLLEAMVSRLYGHSSASGANPVDEEDCLMSFEEKLLHHGVIKENEAKDLRTDFEAEAKASQEQVRGEPTPTPESIWDHYYCNNENGDWRSF
jgi:2-oxoisovalerate dehydrogenase E1 component alpha subunit